MDNIYSLCVYRNTGHIISMSAQEFMEVEGYVNNMAEGVASLEAWDQSMEQSFDDTTYELIITYVGDEEDE